MQGDYLKHKAIFLCFIFMGLFINLVSGQYVASDDPRQTIDQNRYVDTGDARPLEPARYTDKTNYSPILFYINNVAPTKQNIDFVSQSSYVSVNPDYVNSQIGLNFDFSQLQSDLNVSISGVHSLQEAYDANWFIDLNRSTSINGNNVALPLFLKAGSYIKVFDATDLQNYWSTYNDPSEGIKVEYYTDNINVEYNDNTTDYGAGLYSEDSVETYREWTDTGDWAFDIQGGDVYPWTTNAINLGTSTRKWLVLNVRDVNATQDVNGARFCVAGDCRTAWPSGAGGFYFAGSNLVLGDGNTFYFNDQNFLTTSHTWTQNQNFQRIGLNESSPNFQLEINGDGETNYFGISSDASGGANGDLFEFTSTAYTFNQVRNDIDYNFRTAGNVLAFYIDGAGTDVNVGNSLTNENLNVYGDIVGFNDLNLNKASARLMFNGGGNSDIRSLGNLYIDIDSDNDQASFVQFRGNAQGVNIMHLTDSGNVGIGTTNVDSELHVDFGTDGGAITIEKDGDDDANFTWDSGGTKYAWLNWDSAEDFIWTDTIGGFHFSPQTDFNVGTVGDPFFSVDVANEKTGIGVPNPTTVLEVASDQIIIGANANSEPDRTDGAQKYSRILSVHDDLDEEPMFMMSSNSSGTNIGILYIGGGAGLGSYNAATNIRFYTAANNHTLGGTQAMRITEGQDLLLGTGTAASARLHVADSTSLQALFEVQSATAASYIGIDDTSDNKSIFIGGESSAGVGIFGSGFAHGLSIGTQSDTNISFHVNNDSTPIASFQNTGSIYQFTSGGGTKPGCLMMRDTDGAGWTEVGFLNGAIDYISIDADGVCDGA